MDYGYNTSHRDNGEHRYGQWPINMVINISLGYA